MASWRNEMSVYMVVARNTHPSSYQLLSIGLVDPKDMDPI